MLFTPKALLAIALISNISTLGGCTSASTIAEAKDIAQSQEVAASANFEARALLLNATSRSEYSLAIETLNQRAHASEVQPSTLVYLAHALAKQRKFEEAKTWLGQIGDHCDELSTRDKLWLNAIRARLSDDPEDEINAWSDVIKANANDRWAWYELGTILYRTQAYAGAVDAFEMALEIEPEKTLWQTSYIHYLHSKSCYRAGDPACSRAAALPALSDIDRRRTAHYRIMIADLHTGRPSDPTDAIATYREYSTRNGTLNEANFLTNVAFVFFELGQYEMAVNYAQSGYDLKAGAYQAFVLGYSLTEYGQSQDALELLRATHARFPNNLYLKAGMGSLPLGKI